MPVKYLMNKRKKLATKHRLVPLETLYPTREAKEPQKKVVPFYKPGVAARIPDKAQEQTSVRFLQASTILRELKSLEAPLRDVEDDSAFIANAMDAALQVPRAIDLTFNRIHGRIYDIQREIEYSSNAMDDHALTIQQNFRSFRDKTHYKNIINAIHNTIRRDCAPIHECLLGFLLSYSKGDDHMRMLLNRRFLVRNRNALKYWRQWCVESKEANDRKLEEIDQLHEKWLTRISSKFIRDWRDLAFSKHSRKAVKELQATIAAEAQRRLAERTANSDMSESTLSILELLAIEREAVVIDMGKQNHATHMKSLVLRFWRVYVEQCKKASRSGNAIAREFWTQRKKRSFFNAWFSLSVGRVVLFGGYNVWNRPINKLKIMYKDRFECQKKVVAAWRWLCVRRKRVTDFSKERDRKFMSKCIREFRVVTVERKERLSRMMETYVMILRQRMHKVFDSWHCFTAKEKVCKQPAKFMLHRSELMRRYRSVLRCFRRWSVRFTQRQTLRFKEESKAIDEYTRHWASAGNEMRESMILISQLNEKLNAELTKRKSDLSRSTAAANFMRDEQKSLAHAMANVKMEIERLHAIIGKSSMRYFVDIKPVHGHVVEDVPGALTQYIEQKEQEKQRLMAQKAAAAAAAAAPQQRQTRNSNNRDVKRRKTTFGAHRKGSANAPSRKARKSMGIPSQEMDGTDEEEE